MSGTVTAIASAVAESEADVRSAIGALRMALLAQAPVAPIDLHAGRIGAITDLEGVLDMLNLVPSEDRDLRATIDRAGPDGYLCVGVATVPEAQA